MGGDTCKLNLDLQPAYKQVITSFSVPYDLYNPLGRLIRSVMFAGGINVCRRDPMFAGGIKVCRWDLMFAGGNCICKETYTKTYMNNCITHIDLCRCIHIYFFMNIIIHVQ